MTLQELRDRQARLVSVERRLVTCTETVRKARELTERQLADAARGDIRLRPLGAAGAAPGAKRTGIPVEEVRDAVVNLGEFTLPELACRLGCTNAQAKVQLQRVMHLVNLAGKVGSKQMYAYCAPEGPGEAFKAQQRLRVVEGSDTPASGPHDIKQSIVSMVQDKELRKAVREAISQGWELVHAGGKHPMRLVRDDCRPITIVSTPRSSGNAARAVRRAVRNAI